MTFWVMVKVIHYVSLREEVPEQNPPASSLCSASHVLLQKLLYKNRPNVGSSVQVYSSSPFIR